MIELLVLLFAAHWVCDYPLQGDFLSKAKKDGPLPVYHLFAHSGIHAGAILLLTGLLWLALIEWVLHNTIDELKNRGRISFGLDQTLHLTCKVVYVLAISYLL